MKTKNLNCPKELNTFPKWTCDQVAENLFGVRLTEKPLEEHNIASRTYVHIYNVLSLQAEKDREKELKNMGYSSRDNWLENQGSNDYSENDSLAIGKYWHLLTDEMKEYLVYDWYPTYKMEVQKEEDELRKEFPNLFNRKKEV